MNLVGNVKIFKNDKLLVEKSNAIDVDLYNMFKNSMSAPVNGAIDDLFTDDGSAFDGTMAGMDGIVVRLFSDERLSSITTLDSSTATSRTWEGIYTNDFGGDKVFIGAQLGHNFNAGTGDVFEVVYALVNLGGEDQVTLSPSDSIIIQWTISVTA